MSTFTCVCEQTHDWDDVYVFEKKARFTSGSSNKFWRIVKVELPCQTQVLTHYGRWTSTWRNGGALNRAGGLREAERKFDQKIGKGYEPSAWEQLTLQQHSGGSVGQQDGRLLLAALGTSITPASKPSTPVPNSPVVDPVDVLMQRANTLATEIATAPEFTTEQAVERAELLAELATTQGRLDQIESTLEMASALMAARHH